MRDAHPWTAAELLGQLLPRSVRDLMFEPYRSELWRACVVGGCTWRMRSVYWIKLAGGLGLAIVYSTPAYLKGPRRATRVGGVPIVLLALTSLGFVALLRECAYLGIALVLTR